MAVLMVSFRIEEVGNDDQRRRELCAAIESMGLRHWKDTTSFYLIEADASPRELASTLKDYIDTAEDIVLVRSMESKTAFVAGFVRDSDLFELMPYCKRV
jgi:hypothetical protein